MGAVGTWLVSLAGPAIRKILLSLGIGVVSYAAISTALNASIGAAKSAFTGIGADTLSFLAMAGLPTAISVISGALIAKVGLNVVKKFEVLR
jgi:hypothetical protein